MRPKERRDSGQSDLFRTRLDPIVDMSHALAKLGRALDWRFLEIYAAQVRSAIANPPIIVEASRHQFTGRGA